MKVLKILGKTKVDRIKKQIRMNELEKTRTRWTGDENRWWRIGKYFKRLHICREISWTPKRETERLNPWLKQTKYLKTNSRRRRIEPTSSTGLISGQRFLHYLCWSLLFQQCDKQRLVKNIWRLTARWWCFDKTKDFPAIISWSLLALIRSYKYVLVDHIIFFPMDYSLWQDDGAISLKTMFINWNVATCVKN